MKLSVIIPTYKRADDLPRLFDSLSKQTDKPEEVIVVIGPNDQESIAVAKQWVPLIQGLKILAAQKTSVIHALNLGFSTAQNEITCLLDDDVWLPPDWSLKIRKAFIADKKMGAYGGRDHLQQGGDFWTNPPLAKKVGLFCWNGESGNHHCGSTVSPVKVDVLKGVNLSFRRSAFPDMEIDTALESQGAETCWEIDLCQRIVKAGFHNVYDNNNYLFHYWSLRLGFDNRTDVYSAAWPRRIYNQSYVLAKFRPASERIVWAVRVFFVGTRIKPGLVWSVLLVPKSGLKVLKLPWRNLIYIWRGGNAGLRVRNRIQTVSSSKIAQEESH